MICHLKEISSNLGALKVFYDFSSLSRSENIVEAHLYVFLSPVEHENSGSLSMYSLDVEDLFSHRIISRQPTHVNSSHWYKLSLVRWTKRWLKSPRLNQGVEIVLRRSGKMTSGVEPINDEETSSSFTPYLVLYCQTNPQVPSTNIVLQHSVMAEGTEEFDSLADKKRVRHSRSIPCSSRTVVVTVRIDASSDAFFISNGTYTTKKCTGSCQTSRSPNASGTCTQNCCVPRSTKPFLYMYCDGIGVVTLKVIPHAIVEQCYCSDSIPSTTTSPN